MLILMKISEALGEFNSDETDLNKIHEVLSKMIKTNKEEKLISELSDSSSSSDRFKMNEVMREQLDFLANAGEIARLRADSMNAIENVLG